MSGREGRLPRRYMHARTHGRRVDCLAVVVIVVVSMVITVMIS